MTIGNLRRDYLGEPLVEETAGSDPYALFDKWFADARAVERDPTAMSLATVSPDGSPSIRTVLLKDYGRDGFVFYTNYNSRKAREIAVNPRVSLMFYWAGHERQLRVDGVAEKVAGAESDAYFITRPLESRLSVYASKQSEVIESRAHLDGRYDAAAQRFAEGQIPRPEWWGGYRVAPREFEFWQGRVGRMHDRLRYTRAADGSWLRERLAP